MLFYVMDGNVRSRVFRVSIFIQETHSPDAILAACDVEGNFLAIKVCYTNCNIYHSDFY